MPDLAFKVLAGKPAAYMIYSYLVKNFNDRYNYAFPTIAEIQQDLGFGSNTTVTTAIKYLEEKRLIRIEKRKQGTNKYDNNRYVVYYPVALNPFTKEENNQFPTEEIVTTTI
jgi:SOS-response transcriptional repressor LexA